MEEEYKKLIGRILMKNCNKNVDERMYIHIKYKEKIYENISEYEALRNEIISTQATRANYIVYMYSIYTALLVGAIEWNRYFILITFIILISFQAKIIRTKETIVKLSSFIRVFFEKERKDMHWELALKSYDVRSYMQKSNGNIISKLSGESSTQLGFISLFVFLILTINDYCKPIQEYDCYLLKYMFYIDGTRAIFFDILSFSIMIISIYILYSINKKYRSFDSDEFDINFEKYKNKISK